MMGLNFERKDYALIAGSSVLVLLLGVVAQMMQVGPKVELPFDVLTAVTALAGVYFIYRAADVWGGEVGRYLSLIGLGLGYYALTFIPHVQLHVQGVKAIGPINILAVFAFQHVMTVFVFGLVSYGFYLFWKGGMQ